ncbi:GNAT family N-acetyltransferase [Kangiella sediminilitoris]|uniref:GNAT family N-acetyltransferase n=1 Tax=Kangiella sediminilitoris TaxID=1144748 RepID=UPI001B80671E|nr:GNAT family N-acetyltransferase [Kangiella sediminilitoris]
MPVIFPMELIKPTPEHIRTIMEWVKPPKIFNIWAGPGFRYPYDQKSFTEDLQLDKLHSRVLIDGSKLVAFGQVYDRLGHTHLGRLVVNPDNQGQGIGKELIQQLMALGDQCLDTSGYSLFVLAENQRAKHLYEKLGFVIKEYPEMIPMANCYYMVKDNAQSL